MGIEITPNRIEIKAKKVLNNELGDAIRLLAPQLPKPKDKLLDIDIKRDAGIIFLLIDCSGTMQKNDKLEQVKDGILDYAQDAIRKGYSIGIIKFDTTASSLCEPNKNIYEIREILANLKPGGFTNLVDAISLARKILKDKTNYRAMVIITDGMPNGIGDPEASIKEASDARNEGIHISAIGTDDAKEEFLKKLTD